MGGMNTKAVPQANLKARLGLFSVGLLAIAALVSVAFVGTALAAPIAKNGKVNACYRVKGKAKGAMRVVPANKKCRRGEKKLAWNVAGPAGTAGKAGAEGATGASGPTGATGPQGSSNEAALQAKIAGLTVQVEGLEGILQGLNNVGLTAAVKQLPVVSSLCTQASGLPTQINSSLGGAFSGLSLGGTIPPLLSLTVPSLVPITAYTCPS
jgi:hypothetical protein